jgi:hypothetical protein
MLNRQNQHYLKIMVILLILFLAPLATTFGTSVYLIANHHTRAFDAWNIGPPGSVPPITYQATYNLTHANDPGDVAVWVEPNTDPPEAVLFITSEFDYGVEMVDAKTMTPLGWVGDSYGLAGIVVDNINNIVYTNDRDSDNLYAYSWDPTAKTLTAIPGMNPVNLPNCQGAFGLALDDINGMLYVADTRGQRVRVYNVNTWAEVKTIALSHIPMGISIDRQRGILYTVSLNQRVVYCASNPFGSSFGSTLLSKYDLTTDVETVVDMGYGGCDVAVDEVTGYVYLTEGCEGDRLTVWNALSNPITFIYATGSLGSPAAVAIANANVSYNPLNLAKNDVVQGVGVPVGQNFTYEITFNNFDNSSDVTGVVIVDDMPASLDFISEAIDGVPGTGIYDPVAHSVTWNIGTLPAQQAGPLIELIVRINQGAVPGETIYNYATIYSDDTPPTSVIGDDPDDPSSEPGTTVLPGGAANVFGYMTANMTGLQGVYVSLYASGGTNIMTVQTDENGYYIMEEVADGDYTVEATVPLGFQPVTPASVDLTLTGSDTQVDYEFSQMAIGKCMWNYWWWMNQFMILEGIHPDPCRPAELTQAEMEEFSELVFQHFYARNDGFEIQIEGITYVDDPPRPLTYEELKEIFIGPYTFAQLCLE